MLGTYDRRFWGQFRVWASKSVILEINYSIQHGIGQYHKDNTTLPLINKVKPCSEGLVLGWVTKDEYPVL